MLQLEDAQHLAAQDLKYSSSTIQADLDRFQRQKVADMREMSISMARAHRDWCKKVCVQFTVLFTMLIPFVRTWKHGKRLRRRLIRYLITRTVCLREPVALTVVLSMTEGIRLPLSTDDEHLQDSVFTCGRILHA